MPETLIEVQDLVKHFPLGGMLGRQSGTVRAVDGISFTIEEGSPVGLVGESGCGKTTTARLILLLEQPTSGTIRFQGKDVNRLKGRDLKEYKRSVQTVFQDPYSSLNPRMRVRDVVGEALQVHLGMRGKALTVRVGELLENVGLSPASASNYPHEFSGGQRQRIAVARALALNPKLMVLDEPVSALDVSIRAQILNLLMDLQEQFGLSYLLIAHDLALVEHMSHKVAVMYVGQIVEMGPKERLYENPLHPYTRAILAAVPQPDPDMPMRAIVAGEVPNPANPPSGCRFHPRCPLSDASICPLVEPEPREIESEHMVACHKVESAVPLADLT